MTQSTAVQTRHKTKPHKMGATTNNSRTTALEGTAAGATYSLWIQNNDALHFIYRHIVLNH